MYIFSELVRGPEGLDFSVFIGHQYLIIFLTNYLKNHSFNDSISIIDLDVLQLTLSDGKPRLSFGVFRSGS